MKSAKRIFIEKYLDIINPYLAIEQKDAIEKELLEAIEKDNTELPHKESQPEVTKPLLRENKDGSFSLTDEATKILNETFEKGLRKETARPDLQQQINSLVKRVEELEFRGKPMFTTQGDHYLVPCDLVDEWQNGDSIKQLIHDIQKCTKTLYKTPKP